MRRKRSLPVLAVCGALGLHQREQSFEQRDRIGRTAADVQIDRHDLVDAADDRIAAGEDAAIRRAVADRDHPFRIGRRRVGALQRLAHVLGDRTGHQQHVGMARRSDEAQAEALEIVEGVLQRVDLQLAAVARAGIDLADRERAAEPALGRKIDAAGKLGERGVLDRRVPASVTGFRNSFSSTSLRIGEPYRSCPE